MADSDDALHTAIALRALTPQELKNEKHKASRAFDFAEPNTPAEAKARKRFENTVREQRRRAQSTDSGN